jgi:hypothetical protein
MKTFFFALLFCAFSVDAKWTAEPIESGTVWNFDRNCVDLKLKDGKILRIQRKLLGSQKLEAHKTVIEFHKGSLDKDLCQ